MMSVLNNWPQLEMYLHRANMCLPNEHTQHTLITSPRQGDER